MRVLGICSSPRANGNTDTLLEWILKGSRDCGADVEKIFICGLSIAPCKSCGRCHSNGRCAIKDDMRIVYKKIGEADVVVVASPIFFGSISAQLKAVIDRYECRWIARYILGKRPRYRTRRGMAIFTSALNKREYFNNACSIIRNLFAALDIKYLGYASFTGLTGKYDAAGNKKMINKAYAIGRKICR